MGARSAALRVWAATALGFVAIGAVLPVLPYLLGATTLPATVVLAGLSLFVVGVLVSRFTTRTWWYSGGRQLLLGALAGAVTYGIGNAIGSAGGV
jgi:VIT1/CCC1 family predicted Fe2+/Mn2+ transporter